MSNTVNIKDFIIEIEEKPIDNKKVRARTKEVTYEVVLENDMDFVIRRETSRTSKDLVILISRDLLYIKDNKTEKITQLDRLTAKHNMDNFFKDYNGGIVFEKVKWISALSLDKITNMVKSYESRELLRHGIVKYNKYYEGDLYKLLVKNKKLLKYINENFENLDMKFVDSVFFLLDKFNYNNAKYLVDIIKDAGIEMYNMDYMPPICKLLSTYSFDTNTFLDYIVYGFSAQGISGYRYDTYCTYGDYLRMNFQMYGKIKEKYPKYLKTQHDIIAKKYNLWTKYKDDLALLEISDTYKALEFNDNIYSIITPKTSADIVSEGVNNSNCVASYIRRIVSRESMVLFLRDNKDIDSSLVTVEVKDNKILQAKGYNNSKIKKEEEAFIKKWAKARELEVCI